LSAFLSKGLRAVMGIKGGRTQSLGISKEVKVPAIGGLTTSSSIPLIP